MIKICRDYGLSESHFNRLDLTVYPHHIFDKIGSKG